ncbi:MAG: tRNA (guanine-N7-)-methyltransferase [Micromonosporaceae bacterium]|jgi:tRNA (guanine-N7-)-methyltransferase|nr:tRNA (guanine-N7-)-methyltransferase [Micromonosporaceae bacterium]
MERLWPAYGVPVTGGLLDPAAVFGRRAPVVLEIGSGMGEATAEMAAADPNRDYLAVEVHPPGIANLLSIIEAHGLANLRIAAGDALDLIRDRVAAHSLGAVHVFFPDPWPKARHRRRRLIQPAHVALLRSRLAPGATLHCATDSADYARAMRAALTADPGLINVYEGTAPGGYAPRPASRPITKFEQRGIEAGREIFDLIFCRESGPVGEAMGGSTARDRRPSGTIDRP